jgi:tetratricopeptide (TPR) repeat protein
MTAKWLPVEGGIVPVGDPSGPLQEEERFAALQIDLEDARAEHHLRRFDAAEAILDKVILTAEALGEHRYGLLAASAYSLKGRIHWRRAERGLEYQDKALVDEQRAKQDAAFRKAIKLFKRHNHAITDDMPESRLYTDYAIALFRTENTDNTIRMLQRAQATGVMAAEAFAYLGLAYLKQNDPKEAVLALKKGLQLAPGDKVLLETLAETYEKTGESEKALRSCCRAAIAAGKDDDLVTAQRLLRTALRIKPDDAQALSMLTLLLRSQGNDTAAKEVLDATLGGKANPWALGLRAVILRDQGLTEAALSDFRQVQVDSADLAWVLLEYAKTVGASDPPFARKLLDKASGLVGNKDARVAQAKAQLQVQLALSDVASAGRTAVELLSTAADDLLRSAAGKAAGSPFVRNLIDQTGFTALLDRLLKYANSQPERAALLEHVVKRWPDHTKPREQLARLFLEQGEYEKAIAHADEALRKAPEHVSLLALKAEAFDLRGDLDEAVRFYRRASRVAPESDGEFSALVNALTRADRLDDALKEVEHRLAMFPTNGPALVEKGRLLCTAGRIDAAVASLKDAAPLIRDDAPFIVRLQLAQALWDIDRFGEAHAAFERAAKDDNPLGDAHAHMAAMLIEIADYDEAATVLERAIARIPAETTGEPAKTRLAWLWSHRGWALRSAGMTTVDQLKPMFEKATLLAPHDPYATMRLGWVMLHEPGRGAEGERLIRGLIEERTGIDVPRELVGWCHFMLRQYEEAEHWLRGVVLREPSDITTRFDLALTMLAMNREDAEKEFAEASERTSKKARERQRGLFYVAAGDLIRAAEEGCVNTKRARSVWQGLRKGLEVAGLRTDALTRLRFPVDDISRGIAGGSDASMPD